MKRRRVLFLTGTRADFGKLKPLMRAVDDAPEFDCIIFATGMHLLGRYGATIDEVRKAGFADVHPFINQGMGEPMEIVLSNTVGGLSRFAQENEVDLLVVHGDRVEALAGAAVGALRNILVAHVEGGELSGTVDEVLRHAVTKLSHIHFVANEEAAERLNQLGERRDATYVIGSPDLDVMLSRNLPDLGSVCEHYEIGFVEYAIAIFHPVTTEDTEQLRRQASAFVDALLLSERDYVVVLPNNDSGCDRILDEYRRLKEHPRFRIFPSLRFESFLTLLRASKFIVGNSSVGVREAPAYGVPSVNVGDRQRNRFRYESIFDVEPSVQAILAGMRAAVDLGRAEPTLHFGDGRSAERFLAALRDPRLWEVSTQKQFVDRPLESRG